MSHRRSLAWVVLVLMTGCDASVTPRGGPDGAPIADAARPTDAGRETEDAGTPADAGPRPPDAGSTDPDGGAPPDASSVSDGGACVPGECCYRTVETRAGVFHTVTDSAPQLLVRPLDPGEGFYCMRASFTIETADNHAALDAAHEGCPIYSHVATIAGGTAAARVMGTAYFRFLRLTCGPRRPAGLELNAYNEAGDGNQTLTGPWLPGETYRVVMEVRPFTSSIELFALDGTQVGPRVEVDITGATVEQNRDTELAFGLDRIYENAFFPFYDAVYSDLVIEADVAPAP